jgi:hypothetical protein
LSAARTDPATHCPHASADGGGVCTSEVLNDGVFSCRAYEKTCSALDGYVPYAQCDATVASNKADSTYNPSKAGTGNVVAGSMSCRQYHLKLAIGNRSDLSAAYGDSKIHCPHAGPQGGGAGFPCNGEILDDAFSFPCGTFDATCSTQPGYTPYDDCEKRNADNARRPSDESKGVFNPVSASGTITAERMGCRTYRKWQYTRLLPVFSPSLFLSH